MKDFYPSRKNCDLEMFTRVDPILYSSYSEDCPVTKEQLSNYEEKGFFIHENFITGSQLQTLQEEALKYQNSQDKTIKAVSVTERDSTRLRSVYEIHRSSSIFASLSTDPRLVKIATHILGSDIYVHQSRINYKAGFVGKEFYWHSDFETWHVEDGMPRMRCLSVIVALDDNTAINGPIMFIPKSHRTFLPCYLEVPLEHHRKSLKGSMVESKKIVGSPDKEVISAYAEKYGIEPVLCSAGSIVVFDCNVLHASSNNVSPLERTNLFFAYNSMKNQLELPFCGRAIRPSYLATRFT